MFQPIQWSHVRILATTHARYSIRGGAGLIYLLVFLIVGLAIAGVIFDPIKSEMKNLKNAAGPAGPKVSDKDVVTGLVRLARPGVAWWVGADERGGNKDPFVEHLVVEKPPLLSAYLLILLTFIPFISCLAAFNQLSGDIGTKGLRYLLLRTERINIIVARFLGTVLFTAVIAACLMLLVVSYLAVQFDSNTFWEVFSWGVTGWFAIVLFTLPYICLGTFLSASFDSPFAALVLCLVATGIPVLVIKIAKRQVFAGEEFGWLDRLTPWGWMYDMLHPDWATTLLGVVVLLAFSVAFGFLAVRHFLKRDL